jgi:CRISPR-associated protein (TIGR02710 family)
MYAALIATVGGTPQPLVKAIIEHQPKFVCFLCSQSSVDMVAGIKAMLREKLNVEAMPFQDHKVIVEDVNDLVHCYTRAQEGVRKLEEWGVTAEGTVVDITGGTKTMSVALGLATVRFGYSFSYVGGSERTKGGLGIVLDNHEEVRTGISPWSLFAVEEHRRIAEFFNAYQFSAAEILTRDLLSRPIIEVRSKLFLEIVEALCTGYSAWDRFAHKDGVDKIKWAANRLEDYINVGSYKYYEPLLQAVRQNLAWLQQLQHETSGFKKPARRQVADLVANAERRAEEGKYDDAVARLYRALELDGQVALTEYSPRIKSASEVPEEEIPEALRADYIKRYRDESDGKIKLPLLAIFNLLAEVKHPRGLAFLEQEEKMRGVLAARNSSILAHGLTPIGEKAYQSLNNLLRENLGVRDHLGFARIPVE